MSVTTRTRPHIALQTGGPSLLPALTCVAASGCRSRPACGTRMASQPASQRNRRPLAEPPAVASGLSAYPLMELRRGTSGSGRGLGGAVGSHAWLSACVRHIVTTAGGPEQPGSQAGSGAAASSGATASSSPVGGGRGPSLHLVFSGPSGHSHSFQTMPLSREVSDNPQNWGQIAATVSRTGANGLVLVRPIPSPDQHCVFAAAATAAAAAAAATAAPVPAPPAAATASDSACSLPSSCCAPSAACSPNGLLLLPPPPPGPTSSMEGQVGDCCGGSDSVSGAGGAHSHPHPHEPSSTSCNGSGSTCPPGGAQSAAAAHQCTTAAGAGGSYHCPHTQYWGVVVQGATPSDTDGCWVLKTSRSDAGALGPAHGGCTCTHFTLTRVCGGTPLYSQLRDAWLVPQQPGAPASASASASGQQQPARQQLWH